MKKGAILCKNCRKPVGFMLAWHVIPDVFCYSCEDFVTHREEIREKEYERYRHAMDR